MNIAFFLLPKKDVIYLNINSTMRQAMERMKYHRYTSVPIINNDGEYVGVLTEGDLLWKMKNTPGLTFRNTQRVPLADIKRHTFHNPVHVDAQMEDLFAYAAEQNFVSVIDDNGIFIGIVRRSEIIKYCLEIINSPHYITTGNIKNHISDEIYVI